MKLTTKQRRYMSELLFKRIVEVKDKYLSKVNNDGMLPSGGDYVKAKLFLERDLGYFTFRDSNHIQKIFDTLIEEAFPEEMIPKFINQLVDL